MKFSKDLLPVELNYKEADLRVLANLCEPEYEQYWKDYCEIFKPSQPLTRKGFDYYLWKSARRVEAIGKLIETVPQESYHNFEEDAYISDDDVYFVVHCVCGSKLQANSTDSELLCEECGRIYRTNLVMEQSNYLHEDEDEKLVSK